MDKKEIRKTVLDCRKQLTEDERKRAAVMLTERICSHQWFYLSQNLLAFVSYGSEIDTTEILKEGLRLGKKVYVPRVEGDEMQFYRIQTLEELQVGFRGIREPDGKSEMYRYDQSEMSRTLMLMPGAVFDKQKNRIGYGKGYYDRFLSDKEELQLRTIGVGFRCQLLEEIPSQEWDIRPYQIFCV